MADPSTPPIFEEELERTDTRTYVAIAAGPSHSAAVMSDGSVREWGYFYDGHAGFSSVVPTNPVNRGAVNVAAGFGHTLALMADGTVRAWGANNFGQCDVPEGLSAVVAIAAGGFHSLALKADGTVSSWGAGTAVGSWPHRGQSDLPEEFRTAAQPSSPEVSEGISDAVFAADGSAVVSPSGTVIINDSEGLRIAYPSIENRQAAYRYAIAGLAEAGPLNNAGRKLGGAKALLQQLTLLGHEEFVIGGGDIQMLLFANNSLIDSEVATESLEKEIEQIRAWPPSPKLGLEDLGRKRIDILEQRLLELLQLRVDNEDTSHFNLVHNTLNSLKIALIAADSEIPQPVLRPLRNRVTGEFYLKLRGLPYIDYEVHSSNTLDEWKRLETTHRDKSRIPVDIQSTGTLFFRGGAPQ